LCQTVQILDELVENGSESMDVRDKEQVISRMKAAVASKQFGQEDTLCSLVADVSVSRFTTFYYDKMLSLVAQHCLHSNLCLENTGMHPSVSQKPCKL